MDLARSEIQDLDLQARVLGGNFMDLTQHREGQELSIALLHSEIGAELRPAELQMAALGERQRLGEVGGGAVGAPLKTSENHKKNKKK